MLAKNLNRNHGTMPVAPEYNYGGNTALSLFFCKVLLCTKFFLLAVCVCVCVCVFCAGACVNVFC